MLVARVHQEDDLSKVNGFHPVGVKLLVKDGWIDGVGFVYDQEFEGSLNPDQGIHRTLPVCPTLDGYQLHAGERVLHCFLIRSFGTEDQPLLLPLHDLELPARHSLWFGVVDRLPEKFDELTKDTGLGSFGGGGTNFDTHLPPENEEHRQPKHDGRTRLTA